MAGKTLDLDKIMEPEHLAAQISNTWTEWDNARTIKKREWEEVRNFLFATDTTSTIGNDLPWKNKTTTPKLTQIRDNLIANYMYTIFPKQKFLQWEGASKSDEDSQKKAMIESYVYFLTRHPKFKSEIRKVICDWVDKGNCFGSIEWIDERQESADGTKVGFVGPMLKRISPLDIVFNPTAASFEDSPKIIKTITSLGEFKKYIDGFSPNSEEAQIAKEAYDYITDKRDTVRSFAGNLVDKTNYFTPDGFGSYQDFIGAGLVEMLEFYGDIYDEDSRKLLQNRKIVIIDRTRVVYNKTDSSMFGRPQIYHSGWRPRPENLWAMGPLDNLVGMQYRIDHLENLKADCWDLTAFPVLKIKGYVENFQWGPFARINVGEDGDVEVLAPNATALNADVQINELMARMEELAGAPKEAMGFRTPGEKTMYEVQRLENAASRIFQSRAIQFEEEFLERSLNGMLELAQRYGDDMLVRKIDPQFGAVIFDTISPEDLTGVGAIRPIAARHFAQNAELIQNVTNFFQSPIGMDEGVRRHFKTFGLAKFVEEILDLKDWNLVEENVRIAEDADAQRQAQALQEDTFVEGQTDPGITSGGKGMDQAMAAMMGTKNAQ